MKKFISLLVAAVVVLLPLIPFSAVKSEAAQIDFTCGVNATWSLDEYGVLTVSGTGEMYDYNFLTPPWKDFKNSIKKVIIEEGITKIGASAFRSLPAVTDLHIASSVEIIGNAAFQYPDVFDRITIGENSKLRHVGYQAFDYTKWYTSKPDGEVVYLGNVLYKYKGNTPEDITVNVKEGTTAICDWAFYNKKLTDITIPDSVVYIGESAFSGVPMLQNQPTGPIYIGKIFAGYSGDISLSETNFEIKDGTTFILDKAFYESDRITSVKIPASVRQIGANAFDSCKNLTEVTFAENSELRFVDDFAFWKCYELASIELPESTEYIGNCVFCHVKKLEVLNIPKNVKSMGVELAYNTNINRITIDEGNTNIFVDKESVVYTKDKKTLLFSIPQTKLTEYEIQKECVLIREYAFVFSPIKNVIFNDGLEYIEGYAFWYSSLESISLPKTVKQMDSYAFAYCNGCTTVTLAQGITRVDYDAFRGNGALTQLNLPSSLKIIARNAFSSCSALEKVIIPAGTTIHKESFENCKVLTFYCYENSPAHICAEENGFPYVLLDEILNDTAIKQALDKARNIDRSLYTDASLALLDAAVNEADLEAKGITQAQLDEWCNTIESALESLEYKPADYSAVTDAKNRAQSVNRRVYTEASLATLDNALACVQYDLTIDKQVQVNYFAVNIENAINRLQYLPADYTELEAQIEKVNDLDRRYYTDLSLIALDTAVESVDYNLNITEQSRVAAYVDNIKKVMAALEYASVVLRHEPCGVIVSATAKEINPDTRLAVEEVDPSEYEGTNFAVGGSIKSLRFYDINLMYEATTVQPDGTVTVKIKLADGVDPAKCKIYHVTEDIVNPLVRFASTIDGNYIVFQTSHFSEFAVVEVETVLESMEITAYPRKTEYALGEQLDLTGMEVTVHYSNGISEKTTDYKVEMTQLDSVGAKKISIYYTYGKITKTAEFEINVSGSKCLAQITENGKSVEKINKKLGIFSLYTKASVQLGCSINNADGCTVRWSSDNPNVLVDENGRVTCKGFFGAKKASITAEVLDANGNTVAVDTVCVTFYKLSSQLTDSLSRMFGVIKRHLLFE